MGLIDLPNTLHFFAPYVLAFLACLGINLFLFRRLRRKQAVHALLREHSFHIWGTLVACQKKLRMVDLTFTYEIEGKRYSQVQHTPVGTCTKHYRGEMVLIVYDQQKPERAVLKDIAIAYRERDPLLLFFVLTLPTGWQIIWLLFIIITAGFFFFK